MFRFKWSQVNWPNSIFLITTFVLTLTAVPVYIWMYGLDVFQVGMFLVLFAATGLSITLGYHRLFSHRTFQASWPVRFGTLVFGAAAFENSVLNWAADHRQHHKHVDHDDDPYDISKGFFHAHIGWILFKLDLTTPLDCVKDLQQDKLVMWQHRYYHSIAIFASFVLPTILGGIWGGASGAWGGLLIGGVARIVFVQHMTFFINSLCHTVGRQTYSSKCTARDSGIMAIFTFGEGYHNFHHEFQHDYRNGVKPWQWDPTKWCIWLLEKSGMASQLRRVPDEKIQLAEIAEQQRILATALSSKSLPKSVHDMLAGVQERLHHAAQNWEQRKADYRHAAEVKMEASREKLAELRREFHEATERLRTAIREWEEAHRMALAQLQMA